MNNNMGYFNMWLFENAVIEELPEKCVGFVYLITNELTGRKYIGKKLGKFTRTKLQTVTLKNGTKKKKRVKIKTDSDWKDYYGSSEELKKDVEKFGSNHFRREILHFCESKALCSYLEAKEQFERKVLESDDYYNNNIMIRVHGNHIKHKI